MRSDVESRVGFRGGLGALLPADLVVAVVATVLADAVILAGAPRPVRLAGAGALLFFLPGYALVSALYPGATAREDDGTAGLGLPARLALAFGASVAAVALVGLVAWQVGDWLTGAGITADSAVALLSLVVVGGCAVAAIRRSRRPREERFALPYGRWASRAREAVFGGSRTDSLLSVALAVSILLSVGAFGYAVATPVDGERYTTASLLTEQPDGDLVAGGYPSELTAGESAEFVLALENHEGADTAYTAVVRVERVEGGQVTAANELDRLSVGVPAGESRTVPHEVTPGMTGDSLRLSYYVYRGEAPATPSPSSAYRHLYVRLSVAG